LGRDLKSGSIGFELPKGTQESKEKSGKRERGERWYAEERKGPGKNADLSNGKTSVKDTHSLILRIAQRKDSLVWKKKKGKKAEINKLKRTTPVRGLYALGLSAHDRKESIGSHPSP